MKLEGRHALLTGASRGIGVHIARALTDRGARVSLAARNGDALDTVKAELESRGGQAVSLVTDLGGPEAAEKLAAAATHAFGPIDVLINNAGVEYSAHFRNLDADEISRFLTVNLAAPMLLTRAVLPGMLDRDEGHIVNMGSLAGLGGAAFGEAYSATKHGIVGFTRSLRASMQNEGRSVSASVICPGYVRDAGMFADKQEAFGVEAAAILGTSAPEAVAKAVVRAIEKDLAEPVVNPTPVRPLLALGTLFPRCLEWLGKRLGIHTANHRAANQHGPSTQSEER